MNRFKHWSMAGLSAACLLSLVVTAHAADEDLSVNARLLMAARTADAGWVARALDAGAAVNSRNRLGETALVIVLKNKHPELAATLIAAGADVNQAAINGVTPLMAAA